MEIRKRGEQNRVSPKHEKRLIERRSIRTVDNFALESEIKTDIPKIVDYGELPIQKIIMPTYQNIAGGRAEDDAVFAKDKQLQFRHELKYYINYRDYAVLRHALRVIMKPDPHSDENGRYSIRSMYFDDLDDNTVREKLEGVENRNKYRIRVYNKGKDGVIRFEKKIKRGQFIAKQSFLLSENEYIAMMQGDIGFLLKRKEPLAREMYTKMRSDGFRPKVIVDYEREAYIVDIERTRITFDMNVRGSTIVNDIFDDTPTIPAIDNGTMILEIKFNKFLPEHIRHVLGIMEAPQRSAASKYVLCRKYD